MTSPQDHSIAVIAERVDQLKQRVDEYSRRQDRTEQNVQALLAVPIRLEETQKDIIEIKQSVGTIAKEWQEREQWLQQFRLGLDGLNQSREQGIRSGYVTVIVLAVGFISTLVGVLSQVLVKALGH